MIEHWLDIPGYEGRYQISTGGQVRSLARLDGAGHRRTSRILVPAVRSSGRHYYGLCTRGKAKAHCASALMAQAYGIPNPARRGYAIHRNSDTADFRRRNLAWATLAEQRIQDGHKVSSRYLGVSRTHRGQGVFKWVAVLTLARKRHELGYFATPEEAAYAYDREVRRRRLTRPLNGVARPKTRLPRITSLPGEVWRPFPGATRTHQLSNKGRVRTLAHHTAQGQRVLPRLRRITVDQNGFRSVAIRGKRYGIATAMAQTFGTS